MDAKVIVSAYEELPPRRRRRLISRVAPAAAAARAKASASAPRQAGGGYSRRALLLAYAQQLRRRRRVGQQQQLEQRGPPLLEWGEWKAAGRVAAGDVAMTRNGRGSWCSRLRSCARLWMRTFLRRARRIRENASCKK
ncbi:hypothetical protein GQ55_9G119100 [Panicum hallii var. hallii]|uniref:Uncharacterized protein n=1 Tax=Panicum hallii var. hallii TaxID=1504633 RepID=A0A2T7C251_9POAL|nr:hypothetical protein GQ55_9G119100 [Panicum hallii var. hallii]